MLGAGQQLCAKAHLVVLLLGVEGSTWAAAGACVSPNVFPAQYMCVCVCVCVCACFCVPAAAASQVNFEPYPSTAAVYPSRAEKM